LKYQYSQFELHILEFIPIEGLSNPEAKKKILAREQFYLDTLNPTYNICKVAGSSLYYKYSIEAIKKKWKGGSYPKKPD